jgi:tetratricopeptide (TPR) repeat protein
MPLAPKPALPVTDRIQQAISRYSERKFSEALSIVQPALDSTVTVPPGLRAEALNIAAACSLGLNRLADAETYWRQCIDLQPDFAAAYDSLGTLLMSLKRPAEAVAIYKELQKIRPGVAEVHHNLGAALHDLRYLLEAETAYRQAIAIRPGYAQAHFNLALALHELRRLHDAETAYRFAVAARPDFVEAHHNLGNVLKEQGRLSEAEVAYGQALRLKPDNPAALAPRGRTRVSARIDHSTRLFGSTRESRCCDAPTQASARSRGRFPASYRIQSGLCRGLP